MKTSVAIPMMAGALAAAASGLAQAQEAQGRVISSTPVIQQVAVPREVCSDERITYPGQKSGAGALLGGIAGGAMGNAVGNGSGRTAATVIGLIGGAIVGDRVEGPGQAYTETYRRCGTQTLYENRTVAYDVVYEYAGQQYRTQMPHDPGRFVRLSVTPVDALPPAPSPAVTYPSPPPPQVHYVAPPVVTTTRIVVGTQFYPSHRAAPLPPPRVMPINGHRWGPGHFQPPPRHAGPPPRWDKDRWERNR